jgi:PilZ domain
MCDLLANAFPVIRGGPQFTRDMADWRYSASDAYAFSERRSAAGRAQLGISRVRPSSFNSRSASYRQLVIPSRTWRIWFRPKGETLAGSLPSRRQELRIPSLAREMFVHLQNLDNPRFEVAPTIDISSHGARVVSKRIWRPNQELSVRSMNGDLYSRARVVHCQPYTDSSFVIGIELYYPTSDRIWGK